MDYLNASGQHFDLDTNGEIDVRPNVTGEDPLPLSSLAGERLARLRAGGENLVPTTSGYLDIGLSPSEKFAENVNKATGGINVTVPDPLAQLKTWIGNPANRRRAIAGTGGFLVILIGALGLVYYSGASGLRTVARKVAG